MSNIRRASETFDVASQHQATKIIDELAHAAQRADRRELRKARAEHAVKYREFEAHARDLGYRCGICGTEPTAAGMGSTVRAAKWSSPDSRGALFIGRCSYCASKYRTYVIPTLNPDELVMVDSLKLHGMQRYFPPKGAKRQRLAGLSWASFAHRNRYAGANDPGDGTAWSHLEMSHDVVDYYPPLAEPAMARRLPAP